MNKQFTRFGVCFCLAFSSLFAQAKDQTTTNTTETTTRTEDVEEEDFFTMSLEDLMNMEIESAGKKAEKVSEIPASVVVITRSEIEKLGYTSLDNILENITGLYSIGDAFLYGGTNYGVRGFASSGAFNDMMILVNGVNQMEDFSNSYSTDRIIVPVESIDRIEVIRGPMAVVYGSSAFMGVINIITNEPNEDASSKVSGTVANLGTYGTYGRFSEREGEFSYSANVNYSETLGREVKWLDMDSTYLSTGDTTRTADDKTELAGNSISLDLSSSYKGLSFGAYYTAQEEAVIGITSGGAISYRTESSNFNIGYKREVAKWMSLEGKLNFASLNLELPSEPYQVFKIRTQAYEYEVNSYFDFSENYSAVLGFYTRTAYEIERLVDFPSRQLYNFKNYTTDDITSRAGFLQFNAQPIKNLKIVAGLRVEQTNNYGAEAIIQQPLALPTGLAYVEVPFDYEINQGGIQYIPRLAAIYSINEKHILKFMYGQSKKRSSFVESVNLNPPVANDLALADMSTLELNYLSTISSNLGVNFSVYYNDLSNLITRSISVDPTTGAVSVGVDASGKLRTLGSEVTVKYVPIQKLNIEVSASFQESNDLTEGREDVELAYAPKFLGYLKSYYSINEKMTVGLKARYVGAMKGEWNNLLQSHMSEDAPAYVVADLNFRYDNIWKGIYLSGTIDNVLNQEIRFAAYQNNAWANRGVIGFGRRFFLTVGYEF
ncbi:MAG: TonB-dependent receptor [Cytophagales bacterium]|nr:TonB-dependent receptor [Cytophagales bacterium]